jgi:amino acid transporter
VALIATGAITTMLILVALAGSTIGDAYQILVDMTVAMTFIPIAYMFAALPILRKKHVGERPGLLRVPGGRIGVALVSGLGLASTLVSMGFALAPPGAGQAGMFYLKVLGGCALFLGLGLMFFIRGTRSSQVDSEPAERALLEHPSHRPALEEISGSTGAGVLVAATDGHPARYGGFSVVPDD